MRWWSKGSLRNDDAGDGYENVTLKVNLLCLKLYRAYSISFNSSNVGNSFWNWILKDYNKVLEKKRKLLSLLPSSTKRKAVSRCSRATTGLEMYKKAWCTCKVVVALCRSRCRRGRRCVDVTCVLAWVSGLPKGIGEGRFLMTSLQLGQMQGSGHEKSVKHGGLILGRRRWRTVGINFLKVTSHGGFTLFFYSVRKSSLLWLVTSHIKDEQSR